nr:MAG TPA: hypothetical protein [Caudoviricetes sp.]DAX89266.1 MAG TPA: hypothetical protein [Caudoviricetes sp.]
MFLLQDYYSTLVTKMQHFFVTNLLLFYKNVVKLY